jgi:hypothetical protein
MTTGPELGTIKRTNGVAGQIAYTVTVIYEGEPPAPVTFVGSVYGGPIVMVTTGNPGGTFVRNPERFGSFGPEWVRRFFA